MGHKVIVTPEKAKLYQEQKPARAKRKKPRGRERRVLTPKEQRDERCQ